MPTQAFDAYALKDRLQWTAGFLEGEAWFGCARLSAHSGTAIRVTQKQREPLEKMAAWWGGSIAGPNARGLHHWNLYGPQSRGLMMSLYVLLSPKRQSEIRRTLTIWKAKPYMRRKLSDSQVLEVLRRKANGESPKKLAAEFGVSANVVGWWARNVRRYGMARPDRRACA